jgi:predicted RNA binding protein YcfA (HicA-like mRNA interferase family)
MAYSPTASKYAPYSLVTILCYPKDGYDILTLKKRGVEMGLRLPRVTAVELLRALRRDGWLQVRQHGSHVILKHPIKTGRVVVSMHTNKILRLQTLESILEEAELTPNALKEVL